MFIKFMMATVCLPLISMKSGEIVTATQLELMIMENLMSQGNAVTKQELMTENCYEITLTEQ